MIHSRRAFISLLGGAAAAWPVAARGQQDDDIPQIGMLLAIPANDLEKRLAAFMQSLEAAGWVNGKNVRIQYRWAGADPKLARSFAAELIALRPKVIFAAPTSMATTLQRETRSVPIVFAQVADPVGAGLVTSLAKPGGNITGFSHFEFQFGSKWLELLRQISPSLAHATVLYDPANPASTGYLPIIDATARSLGVDVYPTAVRASTEIERSIASAAREPNGGLIFIPGPIIGKENQLIISLANKYGLPNVYAFRYHPIGGGLASYGVDLLDLYRRAAIYVDRILRGEKPADLPVQQPTKFELVINLKIAKALGLKVPPMLLALADEVIE